MSTNFPLLRLPENAQKEVVKMMDAQEIYNFSLLSSKTTAFVRSMQIRAHLFIAVLGIQRTTTLVLRFRKGHDARIDIDAREDQRRSFNRILKTFEVLRPTFIKFMSAPKHFEMHESFLGLVEYVIFSEWCSDTHVRRILNHATRIKNLKLDRTTMRAPPIVLAQNFDVLSLGLPMDLDDLLHLNARIVHIVKPVFSVRDLNLFLRLWIQGSNPRVEYIGVVFQNAPLLKDVIEGINYTDQVEVRRVRKHVLDSQLACTGRRLETVTGGVEIQSQSGILATIIASPWGPEMQMHIWN